MKRKSAACGSSLFSNPLSVETAESPLLSCLSGVSGPASAPSVVCWAASPSPSPSTLSFLSPAPSLSPGFLPCLPSSHYYPPVQVNSPALTIYQSSTPARPWKHPFSISSLLGTEEQEEQESGYDSYHHHHITADSASQANTPVPAAPAAPASQFESNEDSYIDVVGLDEEEEEEDNIKAKENPISNDDSEYKCPMKLLEPDQDPNNANDNERYFSEGY